MAARWRGGRHRYCPVLRAGKAYGRSGERSPEDSRRAAGVAPVCACHAARSTAASPDSSGVAPAQRCAPAPNASAATTPPRQPAPPPPLPTLASLGTQRTVPRSLPHHPTSTCRCLPAALVHQRPALQDPRLPDTRQTHPQTLRRDHQRRHLGDLSNSRVEGINAKIRLINNRAHGHHTADALIATTYLTLGGITVPLPTGIREGVQTFDTPPLNKGYVASQRRPQLRAIESAGWTGRLPSPAPNC